MAKLCVVRKNNVFFPASESDADIAKKFKYGEVYQCEIKKPRNLKFHRKFFALLQYVFDNQDKYSNLSDLRVEILLQCGAYDEHITVDGKMVYVPKSLSFESMDDVEFEQLYGAAVDVVIRYFVKGDTPENIENQVNEILCFL